jgi:hypothetical protein
MSTWLTTEELSKRWKIAENTLRKWRVANTGPSYMKIGDGRNATVRYRLEDIEAFEERNYATINKQQQ